MPFACQKNEGTVLLPDYVTDSSFRWNCNTTYILVYSTCHFSIFCLTTVIVRLRVIGRRSVMAGAVEFSYTRGGQTCSMYEPHVVKPKLQKAAT